MSESNPFPVEDLDRRAIWEMIVTRDTDFFLGGDWSAVVGDYIADGFTGISGNLSADPDRWTVGFPTLDSYRDAAIAGRFDPAEFAEELRPAWLRCQHLTQIDIAGDRALAHKKIDGRIARKAGSALELRWQSVFHLRRVDGRWKIAGFTGYLPNPAQD